MNKNQQKYRNLRSEPIRRLEER